MIQVQFRNSNWRHKQNILEAEVSSSYKISDLNRLKNLLGRKGSVNWKSVLPTWSWENPVWRSVMV